jgi:pimeloyl-ACP methyl ester carboxylesterase
MKNMEATSTSMPSPVLTNTTLKSAHGNLHITATTPPNPHSLKTPTIFLIHGNSSSARIFTWVFSSPLALTHHLLAFDLPGHGDSTNAPDPHNPYTQSGYADAAIDVLKFMDVKRCNCPWLEPRWACRDRNAGQAVQLRSCCVEARH